MLISATGSAQDAELRASVCIIGSGAAGITLACELDRAGFSVLLLEAGGFKPEQDLLADIEGTSTGLHPLPAEYRRIRFGGTTNIWGGRCVPLDRIDFERRDYLPNSGWPIAYEEVAGHYESALRYCDAGSFDFTASGSIANAAPFIAGLRGGDLLLDDAIERYSLPTDFGSRHRARIEQSANVRTQLHLRCLRLNKASGEDRIESAQVVDPAGRRMLARADVFVLAVGGIETPRLLLASDPEGTGLGNRNDLVGRYYACHFENLCARLVANGAKVMFEFEKTRDGVYCRRKLLLTAAAQREHRLLNMAFRLHFPDYSDASHHSAVMSAIYLAKSALLPEHRRILQGARPAQAAPSPLSAHLRNVVLRAPQVFRFAGQWLFLRLLARRKLPYTLVPNADGSYPIEFNSEQTPLASSRISLGAETDRHGMRRAQVDWRVSSDDIEAACRAFRLMRDQIARSSTCRLLFDDAQLPALLRTSIPVGGHHMGAARMAANQREGVVDRNCAVFGLPNLYIASSAVFPTSSHANPTLTIVALAIRLAGHLKARLANR